MERLAVFSGNLPRVPEHPRDDGFVVMVEDCLRHPCLELLGLTEAIVLVPEAGDGHPDAVLCEHDQEAGPQAV